MGNLGVVSLEVICLEATAVGEITHGEFVENELMYVRVLFQL